MSSLSSSSSSRYSPTPSPDPSRFEKTVPTTLNGDSAHPDFPALPTSAHDFDGAGLYPSPSPVPRHCTSAPILAPSSHDFVIASLYPATLILASIFSLLSSEPSYFSQKGNVFNVVFVKYGWFWTTVAFGAHVARLRASSKAQALLRWGLATVWWILVTQWCFGPPIMDRAFTLSGGRCEVAAQGGAHGQMGPAEALLTSAACKVAGGKWRGGHDLSGHVFLLTHASMFLWSEALPRFTMVGLAGPHSAGLLALIFLWWWMLFMTGVYFHTWWEKVRPPPPSPPVCACVYGNGHGWVANGCCMQLTGCISAMMHWGVVYYWALRTQPQIREVLGVPSI